MMNTRLVKMPGKEAVCPIRMWIAAPAVTQRNIRAAMMSCAVANVFSMSIFIYCFLVFPSR